MIFQRPTRNSLFTFTNIPLRCWEIVEFFGKSWDFAYFVMIPLSFTIVRNGQYLLIILLAIDLHTVIAYC